MSTACKSLSSLLHFYSPNNSSQYSSADMSEDCLTLNVFRPSDVKFNSIFPWWSGFTGVVSLETPIIFVSMNYRLGPLGFPQGPEAMTRASLNLGLQDQWVALEWVRNNIASFGGDPSKNKGHRFGESAGALSASFHHLNENFTNVARAAILQSGTASTLPVFDPYRATPSWMLFAKNTPSSDLLAGMNAAMAIELFPFRPVLDGPHGLIRESPAKRLSGGAGRQVPFMLARFLTKFGQFDIALSNDPTAGSPFGTGNETFGTGLGYKRGAAIFGDMCFQAPRRYWSRTAQALSYAYIFTEPSRAAIPLLEFTTGANYLISLVTLPYSERREGKTRPLWGTYEESKQILELNSDGIDLIPDNYRANL
ncbi:Alpha/Beta hydrolase protein [Lactifluus volemus]|nr:Alpha/Beta hydrolase protein [Lactifluus volemus]